jgi:hypothetical protein
MNPKKKQAIINEVKLKYAMYRSALIQYYAETNELKKKQINVTDTESGDYYDSMADTPISLKPTIHMFFNSLERKVLKRIMQKRNGYDKVDLNKLPKKYIEAIANLKNAQPASKKVEEQIAEEVNNETAE